MKRKPRNVHSFSGPMPGTGAENIPPGARGDAFRRPENDEHAPGSGGGPRHAADDVGSPDEDYGANESNEPLAEEVPPEEDEQAYSGASGGAVGGTPAGARARGGRMNHGLAPGEHRGDSTIGADPAPKKRRKRS